MTGKDGSGELSAVQCLEGYRDPGAATQGTVIAFGNIDGNDQALGRKQIHDGVSGTEPLADFGVPCDNYAAEGRADHGSFEIVIEATDIGPQSFGASFPGVEFRLRVVELLAAEDLGFE